MRRVAMILGVVMVSLFLFTSMAFAVANTCTSSTSTVTGTDPSFVVTHKPNSSSGAILYLKFTQGTAETLTLTFEVVNKSLSTDKYKYPVLTGAAMTAYTITIATTGSYRIPLALIPAEMTIICNVTYSAGNQGGVVVANFLEP